MILDCGESYEARLARLSDWHLFFPLLPCTISTDTGRDICAWLQWIERKGTYYEDCPGWWDWEYREKL